MDSLAPVVAFAGISVRGDVLAVVAIAVIYLMAIVYLVMRRDR
jgi:hypothetical protein